jgi:hypothetical protein
MEAVTAFIQFRKRDAPVGFRDQAAQDAVKAEHEIDAAKRSSCSGFPAWSGSYARPSDSEHKAFIMAQKNDRLPSGSCCGSSGNNIATSDDQRIGCERERPKIVRH